MLRLAAVVTAEIEIKKSRFIALLYPVTSRAEAMGRLTEVRQRWPDARHYCSVLLTEGDSGLDDDGEPSGTAAKPMYSVLMHKDVGNVLAVVVRYFGGITLGAGGLVRAYAQAVSTALQQAELLPVVKMERHTVSIGFAEESRVRRFCSEHGVAVLEVSYGEAVVLTLEVPAEQGASMLAGLNDCLHGALKVLDDRP
ncbi:MAG: YigZ family protein [Pseudogulbenkiania sp.]|nr:YigZ family protein [Pseudogulbenkiania sp.]